MREVLEDHNDPIGNDGHIFRIRLADVNSIGGAIEARGPARCWQFVECEEGSGEGEAN